MYRQVLVHQSQRNLQKIFWRSNPGERLQSYTLNTVTYGHASASFLAIRCLFELANECEENQSDIASIIRHDFYVDDMLTGAETIEHAQYICREVSRVLKSGCFELRKWCSNDPLVLQNIGETNLSFGILEIGADESTKTLGLHWSCKNDKLLYNVEKIFNDQKCTKRTILSLAAKIFDPLGLLGPVIVIAKILLQSLWIEKLSWDEVLPFSILAKWTKFANELSKLNELSVNRQVVCEGATKIELHGFADSSERAYGACLYIRSIDDKGNVHVNLLCAKSKVAPVKTLSIPRLELCAALLLARLTDKIINSMTITFESHDNPADYLSRGLYPSQIINTVAWWHGPDWLKLSVYEWPALEHKVDDLPEIKSKVLAAGPIYEVCKLSNETGKVTFDLATLRRRDLEGRYYCGSVTCESCGSVNRSGEQSHSNRARQKQ
ncbi:hypothetical protein NQ318_013713 [Aromia moschata]|uniref:Reverse transcriptase domain-containing protein n=1 Tax=Aromia moschata TaxID=1265417 RepID=A0AAV8Z9D3_9CUCU|nr:hypothetical protein NQ318_013713 [Aromia moschata]